MKLPKELSLVEIAEAVGGTVKGLHSTKIKSVALSPLSAQEGDLALFFEAKLLNKLPGCRASAVLVPEEAQTNLPAVIVKRPLLALQKLLTTIQPKRYLPEKGVHPKAVIDPSCSIGKDVAIGPLVVVGPNTHIGDRTTIMAGCFIGGQVVIGSDCLFHQGCIIADYVKIGNRVILQQGASIGADGFSYVTAELSNMERRMAGIQELSDKPNPLLKIPNVGTVVIEDDVEVGSNTTIDRATMGATIIGAGSKIDNLVMIAHNCRLGKEVIVVAQTGIAGSCTIGDRAVFAGQVGIKDHITVGNDAILEGKAAVMKNIAAGEVVVGVPARPVKEFMTQVAHLKKLPKVCDELKALQKKVEQLEMLLKKDPLPSRKVPEPVES